ncbi:MAG: sigma-70 family RNA polymerase sigma factor, partial [Thermodesulfobacteriota bacterium]|nr:sigma-70 family RNA polymerase sigma factor [Thermodesulfobacteriota bacterium]
DMVQKTFIQAFKNGHKFKEKSEFKTWIFRIALNLCKNQLRRLKRGTDPELEKIDIENKILDNLISKEKAKELYKALNKLPDKQRFTIILRIYHELSYQDIAKIMECPLGTAKANFHHGVLTLKRQFKSGE